jgi:enoyl-CoA hydratase/carnithine racemase
MFDLEIASDVARLTIDRPDARNSIPAAGWAGLAETAERAAAESRVLLLTGSGSAFCAGADLNDFAAMDGDLAAATAFRVAMRDGLDRLRRLPIPTVALVEGACFGAGVALAMACDLCVVGPAAAFAITPAKIGVSYPQEDVGRLVARVGPGQAARLLLSGGTIDSPEALRIGLADLEAAELKPLLEAMIANDSESLAALKRGIRLAEEGRASDPKQDAVFDAMLSSPRLAERLRARRRRLA